ncbi:hypothetical protein DUI87_10723 [Hirundo rustica rustica]|uniref:Uncharacterized protein n=1 Tax=Hirundo rustica rustica TaxID=333673 RepID=A0A3M0KIW9_HIRRU|nr:hypothetical protein DUI87_10723 [Hirundo rustica rustica]
MMKAFLLPKWLLKGRTEHCLTCTAANAQLKFRSFQSHQQGEPGECTLPPQGDMHIHPQVDEILQGTLVPQAAKPASRDPPVEIKITCIPLTSVLQEDEKKCLHSDEDALANIKSTLKLDAIVSKL